MPVPDPSDAAEVLATTDMLADVALHGDAETKAAYLAALQDAIQDQDTLSAYDRETEDHLSTLDAGDPLRQRWLAQGRRNDEPRRMIAETAAMPVPDISHDDQVAH